MFQSFNMSKNLNSIKNCNINIRHLKIEIKKKEFFIENFWLFYQLKLLIDLMVKFNKEKIFISCFFVNTNGFKNNNLKNIIQKTNIFNC